jgi:two-component system response regulator HydG
MQIKLPPLRERKSDIPVLADMFLKRFSDLRPSVKAISDEAMNRLIAHAWPGNVRELENAIEYALALGSGPIIEAGDLPSALLRATLAKKERGVTLEAVKRRAIFDALRRTGGDKIAAARQLHIGKSTLYRRLAQYGAPVE